MARQISEEEWYRQYRPEEYQRRLKAGMYRSEQRGNISNPGLPAPPQPTAQAVADELEYAAAFSAPAGPLPNERWIRTERTTGPQERRVVAQSRPSRQAIADQLLKQTVKEQLIRQDVQDAAQVVNPGSPIRLSEDVQKLYSVQNKVSAAVGRDVAPDLAARTLQFVETFGLSVPEALRIAEMEAAKPAKTGGKRPKASPVRLDPALVERFGALGEVTEDPYVTAVVNSLNSRLAQLEGAVTTPDREGNLGDLGDNFNPNAQRPVEELVVERAAQDEIVERYLARVAEAARQEQEANPNLAVQRQAGVPIDERDLVRIAEQVQAQDLATATPFRQLDETETAAAANALGIGKTKGGRRTPFKGKNKTTPQEAAVLRNTGNVLSQGMEFSPNNVLLPVLLGPKTQIRADTQENQVEQYLSKFVTDATGKKRPVFAPSLKDARVLYINPYAPVSDAAVRKLGLDYIPVKPEKDLSGAYDETALNVPIPDVGQSPDSGFESKYDPLFGTHGATPGYRPPTVAEALLQVSSRNQVKPLRVPLSALANAGAGVEDVFVDPATGQRIPVFSIKGEPDRLVAEVGSDGKLRIGRIEGGSLSIAEQAIAAEDAALGRGLGPRLRQGMEWDEAAGAWRPGAVKLSQLPYDPLDAELQYFTDPDNALQQKVRTSVVDVRPGSKSKWQSSFYPELDDLLSVLAVEAGLEPVEGGYGALTNLASIDPTVNAYQRRLLDEAGIDINPKPTLPAKVQESIRQRNPLLQIVGLLEELAGAPPFDTSPRAALQAAEAESLVAPSGKGGAARLLQTAKKQILKDARSQQSTRSSGRQLIEKQALSKLAQLLATGQDVPREEPTRQPMFKDLLAGVQGLDLGSVPRRLQSAPQRVTETKEEVVQYVPSELFEQFGFGEPRQESAGRQQRQTVQSSPAATVSQGTLPNVALPYGPGEGDSALERLTRMMGRRAKIESRGGAGQAAADRLLGKLYSQGQGSLPGLQSALLDAAKQQAAARVTGMSPEQRRRMEQRMRPGR